MKKIIQFLFPQNINDNGFSILLLSLRLLFGILLLTHGIQKWSHFSDLSVKFADPLGVGSSFSLALAIFGEVVCSLAFIAGFLHRLVLIPMIFTLGVAFFIIQGGDPFASRELAFAYMSVFIILYFPGPGKFSIDYWLGSKISEWERKR